MEFVNADKQCFVSAKREVILCAGKGSALQSICFRKEDSQSHFLGAFQSPMILELSGTSDTFCAGNPCECLLRDRQEGSSKQVWH